MKTNIVLITALLSLLMIFTSCNTDDNGVDIKPEREVKEQPKSEPEPEEEHINQSPGSFDLVTVENDEISLNFSSTFSWNKAVDPDGDAIKPDFVFENRKQWCLWGFAERCLGS